ncbi:MAG: MBL fold metallo-hydrolase [Methanobacteriaceae archaeon]
MEKINDIVCIEGFFNDSNSYLIGDILIDTGCGIKTDNLISKIKEAGFEPSDITQVVNTHCHFDHTGGNYLFENAKVAIHEKDALSIENGDNYSTASFLFNESIKRTDVDIILKEGDKVADFEVISTPGHTPGGICLWDGEVLISGDTIFANGGFGRLDIGGDFNDMLKSIERLKKLDVGYLLPGHGPWVSNGKMHIDLASQMISTL